MTQDDERLRRIIDAALREDREMHPRPTPAEIASAFEEMLVKFFSRLGVDVSTPEAVGWAQRDFHFIRAMRRIHDSIRRWFLVALIGGILSFFGITNFWKE